MYLNFLENGFTGTASSSRPCDQVIGPLAKLLRAQNAGRARSTYVLNGLIDLPRWGAQAYASALVGALRGHVPDADLAALSAFEAGRRLTAADERELYGPTWVLRGEPPRFVLVHPSA